MLRNWYYDVNRGVDHSLNMALHYLETKKTYKYYFNNLPKGCKVDPLKFIYF